MQTNIINIVLFGGKEMNRVKTIVSFVVIVIVLVVCILVFRRTKTDEIISGLETDESYKQFKEWESKYVKDLDELDNDYDYDGDDWQEIGFVVAKKNGDWSRLLLTDKFKEKYNEKDGILGDIQYDKIEYMPYSDEGEKDYFFKYYENYFEITQGKKKTVYIYTLSYSAGENQFRGYLDEVNIYLVIPITDEEGNELETQNYEFDFDWSHEWCFTFLANQRDDEKRVAVSKKFKEKYPNFLDLFIHNSPYPYNDIEFVPEKSDWLKQTAYFIVYSKLEWKERHYIVNYVIDEHSYLDDATAKCVGEYDMEESNPHTISGGDYYDGYDMMFFKNSVISDDLCATDNLKDKLRNSPYKSTFQDIDMIDPNFFYQKTLYSSTSIEVDDDLHQIIKYVWKDGSAHYYDKFIKLAENGDFDEIVFITLPYVDISEDEMKKKFLADKIYLSYEDKVKHMVKKVKK